MKLIPLTQGLFSMVDDEDFDRANQFKWHAVKKGNTFYAGRALRMPDGHWIDYKLHRFLLDAPDGVPVDHVNRNGLDNQRANIRLATVRQNVWNSCGHNGKTKGVTRYTDRKTRIWQATIHIGGRKKFIGSFNSEIEAALAYDKAAIALRGEFAFLNFPEQTLLGEKGDK